MQKVFVTGGRGFLGTWLCQRLRDENCDVRLLQGDITQYSCLENVLTGMDTVFHLAGVIGYSNKMRALMEEVNVHGTANLLEACRIQGVRKIVHVSSVCAIGAGFTEKEVLNEQSPYNVAALDLSYFETKRRAEELVRVAALTGQIEAVILNPSTIYGAGDARKATRGVQLKVARGEFPFYTDGGVSVVAVEDVVEGIIQAWKRGKNAERYILSGANLTLKQLFEGISQVAGVRPPKMYLPPGLLKLAARWGGGEKLLIATLYHWFDSAKATRELGFNPRPAVVAIEASVKWMRNQGLLKAH